MVTPGSGTIQFNNPLIYLSIYILDEIRP